MNTQKSEESSNSAELELLANPSTLWAETERLSKAYRAIMTHIRHKAFAAMWSDGKTLREIAEVLGIPESHCSVVQMRARKALGVDAVPYRNYGIKQGRVNAKKICDHPEIPVSKLAGMLGVSRQTIYSHRKATKKTISK